ncbi:MAG: hypothetical protein M1819_002307 [Sarea resinae]|nr:MAG: hypothetical protein M1819_002307 [Sarea resinae]
MPSIVAPIEYLAKLPLYETEKPWSALLSNGKQFFEKGERLDNVEFEYQDCTITDIVDNPTLNLETNGFQLYKQTSQHLSNFDTIEKVDAYKAETAAWLKEKLGAVYVNTYDCRPRLNIEPTRQTVDVMDPLLVDQPARGAHNDVTLKSGPEIVFRQFSEEEISKYLKPGYRIRIMNTWRPLRPVCEDRPLAFCDADRVLPHAIGEIDHLQFNESHRWYWLEKQTPADVFIMTMYDTHPGKQARYCPHISFENPRAPTDAPPRRSVETRSIVISKVTA